MTSEREYSWDALVKLPKVEFDRFGESMTTGLSLSASVEVRITNEETTARMMDGIMTPRRSKGGNAEPSPEDGKCELNC